MLPLYDVKKERKCKRVDRDSRRYREKKNVKKKANA
jgi:hypothetical protein